VGGADDSPALLGFAPTPIDRQLFTLGSGAQANDRNTAGPAAATAARRDQAVQQVYERFETACDDLDSGLFDLADQHCYCCMEFFAGAGGSKARNVGGHVTHQVLGVQLPGAR
jgi:hypothetical protein